MGRSQACSGKCPHHHFIHHLVSASQSGCLGEGDSLGPWLFPNRMYQSKCPRHCKAATVVIPWCIYPLLIVFAGSCLPHLYCHFPQKLNEECEMRRRRLPYNFSWFDVSTSLICVFQALKNGGEVWEDGEAFAVNWTLCVRHRGFKPSPLSQETVSGILQFKWSLI